MSTPADTPGTDFQSLDAELVEILKRYPASKRSAILPLLHLIQQKFGFISDPAIEWAAAKLELEPIHVLELVTFYPIFRRKPIGRHHIRVCRTLSCALNGGEELCRHLREKLGIGPGQTTPDGKFTLSHAECLASCGTAPVLMVDDDFYEGVNGQKADELLGKYT